MLLPHLRVLVLAAAACALALALALVPALPVLAQSPPREDKPVEPFVPPQRGPNPNPEVAPPETRREEEAPRKPRSAIAAEADELQFDMERPWGLDAALLEGLARQADHYLAFATWFTSDETAREAQYDGQGEASKESTRRYAYLLERDSDGTNLRESRRRLDDEGRPRGDEIKDVERFPPAYAWVFLFSRFNQAYFGYRDLGERFEGFHWVRTIQFRGALPFTDGRDIRQWEGTAIVDAVTFTPIELRVRPSAQREKIAAMFDRWSQAFNVIGFHLAPRPFGYSGRIEFRLLREGLTFPTALRYDTFRAVGRREAVPVSASIRNYEDYRFFKTGTAEQVLPPGS